MVFAEGNLLRIPRLVYRKGRARELLQQEKKGYKKLLSMGLDLFSIRFFHKIENNNTAPVSKQVEYL